MSSSESHIKVGIANNALIVSFLTADPPRVWRADMGQLLTAALEVQDNQGKSTLIMKRNGTGAEEIGTFASKKEAVEALQLVTEALLQGKDVTAAPSKKPGGWFKGFLKLLLKLLLTAVIALFLLITLVNIFGRHAPPGEPGGYTKAPVTQPGVPAPADEILGK